jgi:hypothetical protein
MVKGVACMASTPTDLTDPRPTDPPFLFVMLLAGRKAGDRMLESLARDWLAEIGIHVRFAGDSATPGRRKAVRHVA